MNEMRFEQTIEAPAGQVYRAFTNATALREWLCDTATVNPKVGGHFFVSWNAGYYAAGEYTQLEPHHTVSFSWLGRDEPGRSQINVTIEPDGDTTRLTLVHTLPGDSGEWDVVEIETRQGWQRGLSNLKAVLEQGPDPRIVNRPMLGVVFNAFSPEAAQSLGVPAEKGMLLSQAIEGMGAHKVGLQSNDLIVEMDGKPVEDYPSVIQIIQRHKAGDKIPVAYYRGAERREVEMELSRRQFPEIPATPVELAATLDRVYQMEQAELTKALVGVSDSEATHHTTPQDWNVMEIIAHLILGERGTQEFIHELICGEERVSDGYGDNLTAEVQAIARVHGTLNSIVEAFRLSRAETVAFLAGLPETLAERKSSYWRLAYNLLQGGYHLRDHLGQIEAAISAARSTPSP